jgi:pimeloyl-ACP methyl ester carboxylesterase
MQFSPAVEPSHALVFIHGLLGDSAQWRILDHYVSPANYADCYWVDFHLDQKRASRPTFDQLVRDLGELLRRGPLRRPQPLTLVGSSLGGHLALCLAARGIVRPHGMVLFSPGGIAEAAEQRGLLRSYTTVNKILDVSFERIFTDQSIVGNPWVRRELEEYQARIQKTRYVLVKNIIGLIRSMKQSVLSPEELARIEARTLLVWGEEDIVTPPRIGHTLTKLIPDSRIAWLAGGHAAHVSCPAESSRLLHDFCMERTLSASAVA